MLPNFFHTQHLTITLGNVLTVDTAIDISELPLI